MRSISQCLPACIVFLALVSCSSAKKSVRNIYAYTIVKTPGNIPVDRNGSSLYRGPDTLHLVYVEIKGDAPAWDHAWKNNRTYTVKPVLIQDKRLQVGQNKLTEQQISIAVPDSNKLYQLVLEPSAMIPVPESIKPGELLLQGSYKGKIFFRKISELVELYQQPTE